MKNNPVIEKFCIWGTGKYADIFWNQLREYFPIFMKLCDCDLQSKLLFWVDNNKELQGTRKEGKPIVSPNFFFVQGAEFCVVCALNRGEIYDELERYGKKYGKDFISSEEAIERVKEYLISKRDAYFKMKGTNLSQVKLSLERRVTETRALCDSVTDVLEKKLIFSELLEAWIEEKDRSFSLFEEKFDSAFIISVFAWYFGNHITEIAQWLKQKTPFYSGKRAKPTVGIVLYNYFGGGIEKVVSLLIPLYIEHGHKVVLFTDSLEPDKEFALPGQCERHVMHYNMEDYSGERIAELQQCAKDFGIDIMCFHSGYTHISTFYDMWAIKSLNIPVIMELHSFFYPIIMEKKEVSGYYASMYQITDQLVVLSETDKLFWQCLGCQCVYIQNPIEYSMTQTKEIQNRTKLKNGKTIVWVGRLVQNPKRVLDVVPIMKRVIKKVPDAKLRLSGLATNKKIFSELKQAIQDNDLSETIEICGYEPDTSRIYREADILILTSESESFCNVILESKVWGVPLVIYELPWLELLKNKKGYVSVESKNTDAMAEKVIELLQNEKLRKQLALEAEESVEDYVKYDVYQAWNKLFERIYDIGNDIIDEGEQSYLIIIKKLLSGLYDWHNRI